MDIINLNFLLNAKQIDIDNKMVKRLFEDKLSDFAFNSFALPKGAPDEIPRMVGTLKIKSGNTSIQISNNSVMIMFNFDAVKESQITECTNEAYDINKKVYDAFYQFVSKKITFLGTTINYRNNDKENSLQFIKDKFCKINFANDLFSIENRFALKLNNTYFVNVVLNAAKEKKIPYGKVDDISHSLNITIDINNRYQYDFKNQFTQNKDFDFIKNLHTKIVTSKLDSLLNNGEFDLNV